MDRNVSDAHQEECLKLVKLRIEIKKVFSHQSAVAGRIKFKVQSLK